jgi:2-methylcitrate dehydratase PrpD
MAKSLAVGNAAKNGLAAALFAEAGFSGPEQPIKRRYGFAAVTSDSADLARIADGIGERWEVLDNAYKPYPCGVVLFPVIDADLGLAVPVDCTRPADPVADCERWQRCLGR